MARSDPSEVANATETIAVGRLGQIPFLLSALKVCKQYSMLNQINSTFSVTYCKIAGRQISSQ